jgi:8-oxo-dGTP pyrophosphatase MutT (NUDIX family)
MNQLFFDLKHKLSEKLPGSEAQYQLAPLIRKEQVRQAFEQKLVPKESAVLILLYPKNDRWHLVFTQRHSYKGVHSGQVSFPGGKYEKSDPTIESTALREAQEEIGIHAEDVRIIGKLTNLYVPPSNFNINPFVGYVDYQPEFVPQISEVKEIIECSIDSLLVKNIIKQKVIAMANGLKIDTPYFDINGKVVWGATAMILNEFVAVVKD